jgi:hypothetical protein
MALPRYFDRAFTAIGGQFNIQRDTLEGILHGHTVVVRLGHTCTLNGNSQWTANLLVNLLSRLYPRLVLKGDDTACSNAEILARSINNDIDVASCCDDDAITVSVGCENTVAGEIVPASSGWVASLGHPAIAGPANPFAASFAAALAAGEVFKKSFSGYLMDEGVANGNAKYSISLLDFSSEAGADDSLTNVDIGDVAFVGLGAVGNAAISTLGCFDELRGQAWLVDPEQIEMSNLQRYVLTKDPDGLNTAPKTVIAKRALARTGLKLYERKMPLAEFAEEFKGSFTIPTVCVSVDNFHDRRIAQTLLPRLVVNGYTGLSDIGASWHRLGDTNKQCLACLYRGEKSKSSLEKMAQALGFTMQEVVDLFPSQAYLSESHITKIETHHGLPPGSLRDWNGKHVNQVYSDLICGQLSMQTTKAREEIVPLAHQSAMAGILMGSELVKRTSNVLEPKSQVFEQVTWGNILGDKPRHWGQTSPATVGCICRDKDYVNMYSEKWMSTILPTISS